MVDPEGHVFWTVILYAWPYACIPLAFSIDRNLRARWLLEDVSKPASGYRFKGANMQMVVTSRVKKDGGQPLQQEAHGRSRWLECTNLWWLAVAGPGVFIFAAELSSGVVSVLLVCTPFVCLTLFSLSLNQVTILVSLLASPVVSLLYGVVNRGPGDSLVRSLLWSQAFIALTAVSLAWSVHGVIRLRAIIAAAAVADAAADATAAAAGPRDDGPNSTDENKAHKDDKVKDHSFPQQQREQAQRQWQTTVQMPVYVSPETCIIKAAEAILSADPGSVADEDVALAALISTVRQVHLHGLTVDTPVLQTANSLHAWTKVISHQGEVERDIRETDRWGVLEEKLISMNAGMPSMVGIIQVILLATSQLENSHAYGSDPDWTTFYCSLVPFAASIVVSAVLLARMLALIHRAAHGLAAAAKKTDTAMETFVDLRSWGILRHGEVGCLTHIAASRGMVRALDFLVRNGANPSAVDSTGQTPLQIAEQSGMEEARDYLEMRINSDSRRQGGDDGSGGLISSPLADRLRKKVSVARSPRSSEERKASANETADGGGGSDPGSPVPVYGWRHVQKVARAAVRWVSKSERVLARRRRARVSAEPQASSTSSTTTAAAAAAAAVATAAEGTPSQPPAPMLLPLALAISCRPDRRNSEEGELVSGSGEPSAVPLVSSCSSPQAEDKHCGGAREGSFRGGSLSPSMMTPWVPSPRAEADTSREQQSGVHGAEEAARSRQIRVRRRPSCTGPVEGSALLHDNGKLDRGDEAKASELFPPVAGSDRRDSWRGAEGKGSEEHGGDVGEREEAVVGRKTGGEDETGEGKSDAGAPAQDVSARERLMNGSDSSKVEEGIGAERVPSLVGSKRRGVSGGSSATYPELGPQPSFDAGPRAGAVGVVDTLLCSNTQLASTVMEALSRPSPTSAHTSFRRRGSSVRSTSTLKTSPADSGANITYSPTQAVLNITWALRRLRPLGTPQERRAAFEGLRESSPVHIPQMYLLAFRDLAVLGEIPRRTGDRFLGHASKRPVTVRELMVRADESGDDPVVVYVSHRWLEPDFKNPDDHSKARFYQVCFVVQRLAKRMGRKPHEFYLWIDYACINQQNPASDRLALPYVLDACDFMVYIEDDEYWGQALARTEHFLFRKLRRLRPPAKGSNVYEEDVFSLSADGERLTQRFYAETHSRFTHNPAKGSLKTETDRLYLWTLVLALEYEDNYTSFTSKLGPQDETGFMKLLREAVFVNACADPKQAAAELATRDAKLHAEAKAAAAAAGAAAKAGTSDEEDEKESDIVRQDSEAETTRDMLKAMVALSPIEGVAPTAGARGSCGRNFLVPDGCRGEGGGDTGFDNGDDRHQKAGVFEAGRGRLLSKSRSLDLGLRDDGSISRQRELTEHVPLRSSEPILGGVGCGDSEERAPISATLRIESGGLVGGDIETGEVIS